jgi:hypothetical protein
MTLSERMVEAAAIALSDLSDMGWRTASEYQQAEWRHQARAALTAARAVAEAEEVVFMRWPPDGDDVQACADEVNPYAATAEQYGLTVEMVCDVVEAWKRRATLAGRVTL